MSASALRLIRQAKLRRSEYLDLGNCGLIDLPVLLFSLTWLKTLILSNEWWDEEKMDWVTSQNNGRPNRLRRLNSRISSLTNLEKLVFGDESDKAWPIIDLASVAKIKTLIELNFSGNKISDIAPLRNLTNLKHLRFVSNRVKDIGHLSNLTNLEVLAFGSNEVSDLTSLSNLKNITKLNIKANQVNSLMPLIQLTLLVKLNVDANQLTDLNPLSNLSFIEELTLGGNKVNELKPLENLKSLTLLDFHDNNVSDLNPLSNLKNLKGLLFYNNKIKDLTPLSRLTNLEHLYFFENIVQDLKPLSNLKALKTLLFLGNQVNDLRPLKKLTSLTDLNFGYNQVENLPAFFKSFINLRYLEMRGNKFDLGEEVYSLSPIEQIEAIIQWQVSRRKRGLQPILEVKVMFIGDSKKGKTHLIEMLLTGKFREGISTTHGIERHRLPDVTCPKGAVRVNLWDLGGQNFMRSTHQYFFTERTLYVLVAEAREERKDLNHWLQLVKEIGNNSPVLVVVNKIDLDSHDLDRDSLQRDYPNICDFARTCIFDKKNEKPKDNIVALDTIRGLRDKISAIVTNPQWMPGVFDKRPSEWFAVKEELESLEQQEVDFISYGDYENLKHINSLKEAERRINLKLLASLGTVVTFEDKLKDIDTQVINPQWLLDGVYKILNDPIVKDERKGLFTYADMERILDDKKSNGERRFPRTRYPFLLELMQSNGLCYPLEGKKEIFLIPDLFSNAQPENVWDGDGAMCFRYNYDTFPPDAFMTRFIVAHNADIVGEKRWRSGVVISNGTCSALVRRAFAREHIEIEVQGPDNERREYLAVIRDTFRKLHETYDLKIKREVPYKTVWLNFDHLLSYERNRKPYYHPELQEDIPVSETLNGYASARERRGEFSDWEYFEEKFGEVERSQRRTRREISNLSQQQKSDTALVLKYLQQIETNTEGLERFVSDMEKMLQELAKGMPAAASERKELEVAQTQALKLDAKGKLELVIPFIPGILSYKTEISTDFDGSIRKKLSEMWDALRTGKAFVEK